MSKDTQELILATARRHFVQNGFAAARMQDIADEAGINKALLYYYFSSKEKLFNQIAGQILRTLIPRLAGALGSEGSFRDRLENLVDTYISLLLENPDIPFFIMSELFQKREEFISELKSQASYFPAARAFIDQMESEMREGKIRRMPPMQLFLNIMGMTVFPFIAKPVFSTIFDFSEQQFIQLMGARKKEIVEFIDAALRVD